MMSGNRSTPYYLINRMQFEKNCMEIEKYFKEAWGGDFLCGYSVKTNNHAELIRLAKARGWLAEVVSDDEFNFAQSLGFKEHEIICNGPVKGEMLKKAIEQKQYLNLDSLQEAERLCALFEAGNDGLSESSGDVMAGLRVNFDLEELCPGETTAADRVSRFGICYENGDMRRAVHMLWKHQIPVRGLHMHTSTKTRSLNVFRVLSKMACSLAEEFSLHLQYVDIGGGFFGGQVLSGKPRMREYAQVITDELKKTFNPQEVTLIAEPGASVTATAVDYVTGVKNIRDVRGEKVVTLDGTLLHINPFMAERKPVYETKKTGDRMIPVQHICGCTCMENDRFDSLYDAKELLMDSQVIFHNAGAYTMSFNSHFIVEPPKVFVI